MAARDLMPEGKKTPQLEAAEAWVFKPVLANKQKMRPYFELESVLTNGIFFAANKNKHSLYPVLPLNGLHPYHDNSTCF